MAEVTDRDKLSTQAQATIEWNFGQICDAVDEFDKPCEPHSAKHCKECLKKRVRRHGNNAIRVINGHLAYYNVTQRAEKLPVNISRVARRAMQGD